MIKEKNVQKIARILRADPEEMGSFFEAMEEKTGVEGVPGKIIEENNENMERILKKYNLEGKSSEEIFSSLIYRLKRSNRVTKEFFGEPSLSHPKSYDRVIKEAKWLADKPKGFFLKKKKARELLRQTPPKNMIKAFGYSGVEELLEEEDLFEIYSALRFIEPAAWMNNEFLPSYRDLEPSDFTEREVKVTILSQKWLRLARDFVEKKYHNLSHLKELGVVFVIPMEEQSDGSFLRLFFLLLHYLHEIPFYSSIFRKYEDEDNFAEKVIEALQGKVLETDEYPQKPTNWLIVQRYLSKDDKQDPRLFLPHVNPETLHWEKAEDDIADFAKKVPQIDLDIWRDLDWVGDFYPTAKQGEVLVSFDLIDNIMSLVKEEELIKYLYHQQEALWNKIFKEYVGEQKLEPAMVENFEKGYIEL